jgi:hypothetical protein
MTEGRVPTSYLVTKWGSETDVNKQFRKILDATNDAENDLGLKEWRLSNVEEINKKCEDVLLTETKAIVANILMEKGNLNKDNVTTIVKKTITRDQFRYICKKVATEVSFLHPERKLRAINSTLENANPDDASYAVDYATIDATKLTYRVLEEMGVFKGNEFQPPQYGRVLDSYWYPTPVNEERLPTKNRQGNVAAFLDDRYINTNTKGILQQPDVNNLFEIQAFNQTFDDHAGAQIHQPSRTVRVYGDYFPAEPVVQFIAHYMPNISKTRLLEWTVLVVIDRDQIFLPYATAIMAIVSMVYVAIGLAYNKQKQNNDESSDNKITDGPESGGSGPSDIDPGGDNQKLSLVTANGNDPNRNRDRTSRRAKAEALFQRSKEVREKTLQTIAKRNKDSARRVPPTQIRQRIGWSPTAFTQAAEKELTDKSVKN